METAPSKRFTVPLVRVTVRQHDMPQLGIHRWRRARTTNLWPLDIFIHDRRPNFPSSWLSTSSTPSSFTSYRTHSTHTPHHSSFQSAFNTHLAASKRLPANSDAIVTLEFDLNSRRRHQYEIPPMLHANRRWHHLIPCPIGRLKYRVHLYNTVVASATIIVAPIAPFTVSPSLSTSSNCDPRFHIEGAENDDDLQFMCPSVSPTPFLSTSASGAILLPIVTHPFASPPSLPPSSRQVTFVFTEHALTAVRAVSVEIRHHHPDVSNYSLFTFPLTLRAHVRPPSSSPSPSRLHFNFHRQTPSQTTPLSFERTISLPCSSHHYRFRCSLGHALRSLSEAPVTNIGWDFHASQRAVLVSQWTMLTIPADDIPPALLSQPRSFPNISSSAKQVTSSLSSYLKKSSLNVDPFDDIWTPQFHSHPSRYTRRSPQMANSHHQETAPTPSSSFPTLTPTAVAITAAAAVAAAAAAAATAVLDATEPTTPLLSSSSSSAAETQSDTSDCNDTNTEDDSLYSPDLIVSNSVAYPPSSMSARYSTSAGHGALVPCKTLVTTALTRAYAPVDQHSVEYEGHNVSRFVFNDCSHSNEDMDTYGISGDVPVKKDNKPNSVDVVCRKPDGDNMQCKDDGAESVTKADRDDINGVRHSGYKRQSVVSSGTATGSENSGHLVMIASNRRENGVNHDVLVEMNGCGQGEMEDDKERLRDARRSRWRNRIRTAGSRSASRSRSRSRRASSVLRACGLFRNSEGDNRDGKDSISIGLSPKDRHAPQNGGGKGKSPEQKTSRRIIGRSSRRLRKAVAECDLE